MTIQHSGAPIIRRVYRAPDDIRIQLGNDSDIALVLRSTVLAADAEVTDVLVGTSDHQGVAANSVIISNITASGDILLAVNNGGNSLEALLIDASVPSWHLGFGLTGDGSVYVGTGNSFDVYINKVKEIDYATGALVFQQTTTISASAGTLSITSPTLTTPALGTPASGVMTNVTGVPAAAILAGSFGAGAYVISTSLQAATIELGHATDTTLARSAAGVMTVEGVVIPSISSTDTLTNKRINPRVVTTADDATAVIDVDVTDQYQLTAMANATTISTTGTPVAGQKLVIRLKDNGTGRALTWDAVFRAVGVTLPTTTVANKTHYIGCLYNLTDTKWDAIAVVAES